MTEPTEEEKKEEVKSQIADLLGDDIQAEEDAEVAPAAEPEPKVESEPAVESEPTPAPAVAPAAATTEEEEITELPAELPTDPAELQKLLKSFATQATSLRGALNEMAQRSTAPVTTEVTAAAPVSSAAVAKPPVIAPKDAIDKLKGIMGDPKDYLSKEELDLVSDKPELINVAIQRGMERMTQAFVEALPSLTGEFVKQHTAVTTVVDQFYKDNPDLVPFKKFAMTISQDIAKDPNISVQDMLVKTAAEVRKSLRLPTPKAGTKPVVPAAKPVVTRATTKPAFAQQRRVASPSKSAPDPNSKVSQIKDLLS